MLQGVWDEVGFDQPSVARSESDLPIDRNGARSDAHPDD